MAPVALYERGICPALHKFGTAAHPSWHQIADFRYQQVKPRGQRCHVELGGPHQRMRGTVECRKI